MVRSYGWEYRILSMVPNIAIVRSISFSDLVNIFMYSKKKSNLWGERLRRFLATRKIRGAYGASQLFVYKFQQIVFLRRNIWFLK